MTNLDPIVRALREHTHGGVAQNGGTLTGQLLQLQAGIVAAGVLQLYR